MQLRTDCCGCGLCESICPKDAIVITENEQGFLTPIINEQDCISCSLCQAVCSSEFENPSDYDRKAYGGGSTNHSLRIKSSSGGSFGEIAKSIIRQNGVVYGASFAAEHSIVHLRINNTEDLAKLQGSKYVQSRIGMTFKCVRDDLIAGRKVLFSGTPCQIEGLYKYLGKKYNALYTVDIICHGVASRNVWKKYVDILTSDKKNEISDINFRDKQTGWHRFSFSYKRNGKKIHRLFIDDPFCFFFDKHFIINQACFTCKYALNEHFADITLGDLWGIEHFKDILDDNKGVSLVIVSSKKGEELLSKSEELLLKPIDLQKAISFNLHEPPKKPNEYEEFCDIYSSEGIKKCINVYFYKTFLRRCKLYVKAFLTKTGLINYFIK